MAGAPESGGHARLDDGTDPGQTLVMRGRVLGEDGKPLANALVEVWHANHLGNYSYFDKSQPAFNLRRSIRTDASGYYSFRSVVPVGYSVPPQGQTQLLLDQLGRVLVGVLQLADDRAHVAVHELVHKRHDVSLFLGQV